MTLRGGCLLVVFVLAACATPEPAGEEDATVASEPEMTVAPENMPTPPGMLLSEKDKANCLANGGTVERRGMMQAETCVTAYSDAGKVCRDGDDCEGKCLSYGQVGSPPGEQVEGICERDDRTFGCFGIVEDGAIEAGLCVD